MTPTFSMPESATRRRRAALAAITDALCAARCSVRLAGLETTDFLVRELLLAAIDHLDQATAAARRLV